jgi:hypothetical protein
VSEPFELAKLDSDAFEHLVNALALQVLGAGHTGFGPGADGGRDGYFEGEAPYPSLVERWSGIWYIQSKFHKPHLSKNPQKWLLEQIEKELEAFSDPEQRRFWPDNWIVATNIDPSGTPETGSFDKARALVIESRPELEGHFHIWGGRKILDFLANNPNVAAHYSHLITPGAVFSSFFNYLADIQAEATDVIRALTVGQLTDQQFTKLEQAGSSADNRPGIHRLFTDLPFMCRASNCSGMAASYLSSALAQNQRPDSLSQGQHLWQKWRRHPKRARIWFVKGGPGQGKSTLGQYLSQIQRAAIILQPNGPAAIYSQKVLAREIQQAAEAAGFWPLAPRVPVTLELKNYAQWYARQPDDKPKGILSHLAETLSAHLEQPLQASTLKRFFGSGQWLFVFDGLDEVPSDVKDFAAAQVTSFTNDILISCNCDALIICTSRPQGYAGQFAELDAAVVDLPPLAPHHAIACARPVLEYSRTRSEANESVNTLEEAINSPSIAEIMTTPLQAHIMAVVVRDGGKPPERKWALFNNFYQTIKKREANRKLPDRRLATLLQEGDKLLKAIHNRLGFELHYRAERSEGAQTSLERSELRKVVEETVSQLQDDDIRKTVETLMEATTERLVLVSTPEASTSVRFDIRPLQEYFAAEYIYESTQSNKLVERLRVIAADSHWREVMHFLLSALVENGRQTELSGSIDILSEINVGDPDQNTIFFHRRIAAGALLTCRLLNEGVLEQDKRIRQQFAGCLEPLFACTDPKVLMQLTAVRRPQSLTWLQSNLLNRLVLTSRNDVIGAAAVLCLVLDDEHPRLPEFLMFLNSSTASFTACMSKIVQNLIPLSGNLEGRGGLAKWLANYLLGILEGSNWLQLGASGIEAALGILRFSGSQASIALQARGVSPEVSKEIVELIGQRELMGSGKPAQMHSYALLGVQIQPLEITVLGEEKIKELSRAFAKLGGAFKALDGILQFAKSPSRNALATVFQSVDGDTKIIQALPKSFTQALPWDVWGDPTPARFILAVTDESKFSELMISTHAGYQRDYRLQNDQHDESEWRNMIDCYPRFALWIYAGPQNRIIEPQNPERTAAYLESDQFKTELKKRLLCSKDVLIGAPGSWGKLLDAGHLTEFFFRDELLKVALREPAEESLLTTSITPFVLFLPKEADLLPHLINIMVLRLLPDTRLFYDFQFSKADNTAGKIVEAYVPSEEDLLHTVISENLRVESRAAAAMMYLLHPRATTESSLLCANAISEIYFPGIGSWYLRAAAISFQNSIIKSAPVVPEILNRLIQKSAASFEGRMDFDRALDPWRQESRAPVHRSDIELWRG